MAYQYILVVLFISQILPSLLAKASRSPEGENPTVCTHPPAGLLYTPQTVLKGSFEPHTVGAGLNYILTLSDLISVTIIERTCRQPL